MELWVGIYWKYSAGLHAVEAFGYLFNAPNQKMALNYLYDIDYGYCERYTNNETDFDFTFMRLERDALSDLLKTREPEIDFYECRGHIFVDVETVNDADAFIKEHDYKICETLDSYVKGLQRNSIKKPDWIDLETNRFIVKRLSL